MYSDLEVDYLKMLLLNLPGVLLVMLLAHANQHCLKRACVWPPVAQCLSKP